MAFHITHLYGNCESDPPPNTFDALYDELQDADPEHTDVSVTHDSEWSLSAFRNGLLIWENVEKGDACHMRDVDRDQILRLWRLLADGDIDRIRSEDWQNGYG